MASGPSVGHCIALAPAHAVGWTPTPAVCECNHNITLTITITIQGRLLKKKCTFQSGLCLKYIYVYNGVTIHRIVATGHHQSMKGFRGSWNRRILILLLVIITHDTTKITDHLLIYCKHLPNTHRFHDHGISQSITLSIFAF